MKIGVLAVQGAFAEHIAILNKLGVAALPIRLPPEVVGLDGLIIPGGESTSISKLIRDYHLSDEITSLAGNGLPILGICAGMILMSRRITDSSIEPLGLMAITVRRNAFGRQQESFETELSLPVLGNQPFPGVFIRAPIIEQAESTVDILARLNNTIIAARQGNLVALAFHPELTNDLRFHQYFLSIVAESDRFNLRGSAVAKGN
ncbi:MAG: pyridoxal 5'-phosphate synthase glutaminase subunit PdxT [Dehalococcoidales bacterium]|nr:pyridoxal 5'-phosphate synthase glutaminase subunit PdxT [Dehalococcoidales bacterium]